MKINDVVELVEAAAYGAPGSRAMGTANFALLSRHYTKPSNRTSANLVLDFGGGRQVELSDSDVDAIAKYYDTLPTDADRYDFVYDTMSRDDKFNALLNRLGVRKPPAPPIPTSSQTAMDLSERDVKQNSSSNLDRGSVRSAALSTALRQAYAKYPQAQSDMEALVMHDMDVQKNTGQELKSQDRTNQRQDDIDIQLRDVNRQQNKKISTLDQENDDLTAELDRLSQELDAMHGQTGTEPERKKDSDTARKSDTDTNTRSYGSGTVGSVTRAEKSQQRAADAEKRKDEPEPARLKPGSIKPSKTPPVNIGATPAMAMPVVKPPVPTIDVIDEPGTSAAIGQMAKSLSDPAKSPALGQVAQSLTKPPAIEPILNPDQALPTRLGQTATDNELDPDSDADSAYTDASNSEDRPDNVFQFPDRLSRTNKEPGDVNQPDLFDNPPRTGTYNESQELRRMRELAGLRVNEADSFYTPPVPGVFAIRVNAQFINDYSPSYRPENPEILWNGLSTVFPRDYPRVKFGTPNCPQADVFAELKDRTIADVKTGLTQDMAETLADRLGKSDPTGQLSRFIQVIQKRPQSYENKSSS
jgi:hypothetical protein